VLNTTPSFSLRPASERDADFIHALRAAGLREHVERIWGWDEAAQWARFRERFDPSRYRVIVVGGRDVGAISVVAGEEELLLADLEILPAWRGKGLGTALIRETIAESKRLGRPLSLQVLKGNRALRLYERLGFRVVGETATHVQMRHALPRPAPGCTAARCWRARPRWD
jgi:ribosomal protein S18 acetylase RimI-like enzyme